VRDELAHEIAQKLGIDSAVLRQELRHAAATREKSAVKAPAEAQATDAEKILIRALASARQMQNVEEHLSARDGAEEEFDPARQANFVLQNEQLHRGLATESLAESLLNASAEVADVMEVPATETDRRMLATILFKEEEDLTAEVLEAAVRALRKIVLDRRRQEIGRALERPGNLDRNQQIALAQERLKMKLAERSPDSRIESPPDSTRS
jgi:DNA primase